MNTKVFEKWMKQSGLVKQLQCYLALSVVFNLFLGMQLVNANSLKPTEQVQVAESQGQASNPKQKLQVTEASINNFIRAFLDKFFKIDEESFAYIKEHSDADLFTSSLEAELKTRRSQEIKSKFRINSMYFESIGGDQVKAYCFGDEVFLAGDYQDRSFEIQLIINLAKGVGAFDVVAIPVFHLK